MKTKIVGLALVVIAVTIVAFGFVLPLCNRYMPTAVIWETIFEDYYFLTVGFFAGISIVLLWGTTIIKNIACLLACSLIGLLINLFVFSVLGLFSFPGSSITIGAIGALLVSAGVFLIKGVEFMFFPN